MGKYIDAERLKAEIERRLERYDPDYTNAGSELKELLSLITSLQQERPEDISVPKWLLKNIEDTLRIQNNINNDKEYWETCQDRNIRGCLNGVRKILNGEELTGMERLEPLREQSEVDLDAKLEADIEMEVEKMIGTDYFKQLLAKSKFVIDVVLYTARHFYELGLNARKEK